MLFFLSRVPQSVCMGLALLSAVGVKGRRSQRVSCYFSHPSLSPRTTLSRFTQLIDGGSGFHVFHQTSLVLLLPSPLQWRESMGAEQGQAYIMTLTSQDALDWIISNVCRASVLTKNIPEQESDGHSVAASDMAKTMC